MAYSYKTLLLLIGDVIVLYLSLLAMFLVRFGGVAEAPLFAEHIVPFTILFALWIIVFYIHGLYDLTSAKNKIEFYAALSRAVVINFAVAIALFYFVPFFGIAPKTNLFITLGLFAIFFSLWRQLINQTLKRYFRQATMLAGPLKDIERIRQIIESNPQIGYRVALVFTERRPDQFPGQAGETRAQLAVYTPDEFAQISNLARQHEVRTAVVAAEAYRNSRIVGELEKLLSEKIEIVPLEVMEERLRRKVRLERIDELWFFDHFAADHKTAYETFKRLSDVLVAVVFLPLVALIGFFTALAIKLEDRGPLFYTQLRVGRHGRIFRMYKFRTMQPDAEKGGAQWTIEQDPRITRIGRFLRKTRLDELPQIVNVLRGEMSFVGPRAERPEFHELLKKEIPFYERRYLIKPGLTGWAQINYTYGSSVEDTREKLAYDFYYLKSRSFVFDLGIILKTIDLVLRGLGR